MSEPPHDYTGELRRANADGSEIVGFLVDRFGYRLELRGCKDPRAGHGYLLHARLVYVPPQYRQEAIDGEAEPLK